jgi:D-alanine-D-alanine ligase
LWGKIEQAPVNRRLNITVMMGGPSAEREVSLRSGAAVAGALRARGHTVYELDPAPGGWQLPSGTEVVMLALHGTYGEDGTVQRELEALGVPYTGCDAEASRIAFDKLLTKQRCLDAGVPTPRFQVFSAAPRGWPDGWQPPVVLKPLRQGSSVGLEFVDRREALGAAVTRVLRHDSAALLEERIEGMETTVAILEGEALPVVEVVPRAGAYDYTNKYTAGRTDYYCPARLAPETAQRVQAAALGAYRAVGARDYARVDVMVSREDQPWVLEVNTLPGMTELSLLPKAAAAAGLEFGELCQRLVEQALKRRPSMVPASAP